MKNILKVEELGFLALFTAVYFHFYPGTWGLYLALFFAPDISFAFYLENFQGLMTDHLANHGQSF